MESEGRQMNPWRVCRSVVAGCITLMRSRGSASQWEVGSGSASKWEVGSGYASMWKVVSESWSASKCKEESGSELKWSGSATLGEGGSFRTHIFFRKAWVLISRLVASALFMFFKRLFSCLIQHVKTGECHEHFCTLHQNYVKFICNTVFSSLV